MIKIPLTKGKFAIVDDEDYQYLSKWEWKFHSNGYACRSIKKDKKTTTFLMHRIVNQTPDNLQTDHINGDRLDNRKENLRTATYIENNRNMPKTKRPSSSKYKGVHWVMDSKKWRAQIRINGKKTCLGFFQNEDEAAFIYNEYAKKCFGNFARLNVIS